MILPRIESTSQLCLIRSPYLTSTSESTGHTVTGMEKHLDAKITIRRINLQGNVVKRSMTASTTDTSATKHSGKAMIEVGRSEKIIKEMDQLASEDHTYKATKEEIDVYRGNWWIHTNVAHFDSVPTRYHLISKRRCRQCNRLMQAEDEKQHAKWSQSSSSSWQWHANWWESDFEYSTSKMV